MNTPLMRVVCMALVLAFLSSCVQIAVDKRLQEYKAIFEPMLGSATKEDIVRRFGAPQDRQFVGSIEVWTYHRSFGTRGGAYVPPYNQYGTYASTQSHEVYDRITLTFNAAGMLDSWNAYVQR